MSPTPDQEAAMEAIFALCEAVGNKLTLADLMAVVRMAVADGHGQMIICLAMASVAIQRVAEEDGIQIMQPTK
jgi:hypothetical protein